MAAMIQTAAQISDELRQNLGTWFGTAAADAADRPESAAVVAGYLASANALQSALQAFGGAEEGALALENAARAYRLAFRALRERVEAIVLETMGTGRPQ